jgi:HTH-type transcriptional regulator/antitoxin HigA
MKPKLIKTDADYRAALNRIDGIFGAKPGSPEGDELELLVTLVELYEEKAFPIDLPSPVDAIKFRMEQQGLKAKDLVPYIGSASKVSEVLAGKRSLSLTMIRNLVNELGIPAEVLLQEPGAGLPSEDALQEGRQFPIAEMVRRRWFAGFEGTVAEAKRQLEDLLNTFVGPLGRTALIPAFNRQHVRLGSKPDQHALTAWRIRAVTVAMQEKLPGYKQGTVTLDFLRQVARLSFLDTGPLLAKEFLNKHGIHLVCERHLSKTHLDGAALKLPDGSRAVALTLRHDRLDNFWFTLFHELAHVALHLDNDGADAFFDDLTDETKKDKCEKAADKLAADALIPESEWKAARFKRNTRTADIVAFAEKLRISPAIPAGRIRYEAKDFAVFKPLIGTGKVRPMFDLQEK